MAKKQQTTLNCIADKLSISVSIVSRVLSGQTKPYRIGKKTQEAVLSEAKRLGFSPNQLARSLRLQKTHTLGLGIPDISILSSDEQPYFAFLATRITTLAQQNETMGQIAVSLLLELEQIENKDHRDAEGVMLPTTLIRRDSVRMSGQHIQKVD